MNVNKFIEELKDILKDKLDTIFVYGSKTGIPAYDLKEGADLMIIVQDLKAEDLKSCTKAVYKWTRKNPVPVFMSTSEWFSSADVYPMEYADIKENHHILYGTDIISVIDVKYDDLRLQCEREAKNMLMRFRKEYLLFAPNKKRLERLILASLATAMAVLKAVLRLKNLPAGETPYETVRAAGECGAVNSEFFEELILFKEGRKKLADIDKTAQKFIDEADRLLKYTDKL